MTNRDDKWLDTTTNLQPQFDCFAFAVWYQHFLSKELHLLDESTPFWHARPSILTLISASYHHLALLDALFLVHFQPERVGVFFVPVTDQQRPFIYWLMPAVTNDVVSGSEAKMPMDFDQIQAFVDFDHDCIWFWKETSSSFAWYLNTKPGWAWKKWSLKFLSKIIGALELPFTCQGSEVQVAMLSNRVTRVWPRAKRYEVFVRGSNAIFIQCTGSYVVM